jgi:lipopolysaccharide export system permease protein
VFKFSATIPVSVAEEILDVQAAQGRYIPYVPDKPLTGGWLLHGARLLSQPTTEGWQSVLIPLKSLDGLPLPMDSTGPLAGATYFLSSDLTFESVTRNRQWYQFATTTDLVRSLRDPTNKADMTDIEVALHSRLLRPLASLTLLGLSLPLVLGGQARNMFINLGLSLLASGCFYAVAFMSQYFGSSGAISPELAAWAPVIAFGTIAIARWDTIRT